MRAFRLAYDGTGYRGFQRQPDVPTVENAVFDALRQLEVLDPGADRPDGYAAAGRTDAGVSALAQTVPLEAPDWLVPRAFNSALPEDVRAWAVADAPREFHATHDATERTYAYHLYAPSGPIDEGDGHDERDDRDERDDGGDDRVGGDRIVATVDDDRSTDAVTADPIDVATVDDDRIDAALESLAGTHDLDDLTPDDRNTERTLALEAGRDGDYLVLEVRAGGFPRQLVRRLVSLVRAVGTGERSPEAIDRVLSSDPLSDHEGVAPAPPEPLVLSDVTYPALSFSVDSEAAASARAVFEGRRVRRQTGARVSGYLAASIRGPE